MVISGLAGSAGDAPQQGAAGLLAGFRAAQRRESSAQAEQVELAVAFCAANPPDPRHRCGQAATVPGTEGGLWLAGAGAPGVAEFAVVEFGAVTGRSTDAARRYLGQALELAHRLPSTWREVRSGRVEAWRGRRIAEHTMILPAEGAAWVDAQVAGVAGRVGVVVLDRLVNEAIVRFDPETAAHTALEALETRHATVTLEQVLSEHGAAALSTGRLDAILDAADALDLDAALADLAADLATAGDTDPLDVRRAKALGLLARGQGVELPEGAVRRRRREVVLHVHLTDAALRGAGDGILQLATGTGRPLGPVTVEQVQHWCGSPETTVTVKPVLDLAETLSSTGYQAPARLRDHVVAANPTCVFPYCHRPADGLDLDHIEPYTTGGPTSSTNLAPLCRRHHRTKTHAPWHYLRLGPGEYLWTSPQGYRWITEPDGTRDVSTDLRDTG